MREKTPLADKVVESSSKSGFGQLSIARILAWTATAFLLTESLGRVLSVIFFVIVKRSTDSTTSELVLVSRHLSAIGCLVTLGWMMRLALKRRHLTIAEFFAPLRVDIGLLYCVIVGVALCGLNALLRMVVSGGYDIQPGFEESVSMTLSWGLSFLSMGVAIPIAEEFLFRGLLLKTLSTRIGTHWAVIASVLVFVLYHIPLHVVYPVSLVGDVVVGIATAVAFIRTGSLSHSIAIHAAYNVTAITIYHAAFQASFS